jgi:spermidine synthase
MRPARVVLPSILDVCPRLRPRTRRTAVEIRRLLAALARSFPDAAFLARDPRAAEWLDTTPYDHVAADVITAARALSDVLVALDHPL